MSKTYRYNKEDNEICMKIFDSLLYLCSDCKRKNCKDKTEKYKDRFKRNKHLKDEQ
jgi:hypothetical protein